VTREVLAGYTVSVEDGAEEVRDVLAERREELGINPNVRGSKQLYERVARDVGMNWKRHRMERA